MNGVKSEIFNLLGEYGTDDSAIKEILRSHDKVDYLYALSDIRENVLEWFDFKPEGILLQIGADYGALTGLYSRKVSQVVVLDLDEDMLEITKRRHKGRANIRYYHGSLEAFYKESQMAFDYVVMLGSLTPPFGKNLRSAKGLVKEQGCLIMAACNQFGLKYLAGIEKDPFSFSREEITKLLTWDDLSCERKAKVRWYYPMPDYKLPTAVYSEHYLPRKGDLTHTITAYDYPKYLLMDVGAAYDAVCEDNQFEYFANSFLMIWSKDARN